MYANEAIIGLAVELIAQSLADLRAHSKKTPPQERVDALRWFDERSTAPCGYGWALSVSGANPNQVRRTINKLLNHHPTRHRTHATQKNNKANHAT